MDEANMRKQFQICQVEPSCQKRHCCVVMYDRCCDYGKVQENAELTFLTSKDRWYYYLCDALPKNIKNMLRF